MIVKMVSNAFPVPRRILQTMNEASSNTSTPEEPCVSGTTTAASYSGASQPSFAIEKSFMYGVLMVLGLIFAGYLLRLLMDRIILYLRHGLLRSPPMPASTGPSSGGLNNNNNNDNTYKGLVGLRKEERRQLLQHMLLPTIYISSGETSPLGSSEHDKLSNDAAGGIPLSDEIIAARDIEEAVVANVDADADAVVISIDERTSAHDLSSTQVSEDYDYQHSCSICLSRYRPGTELLRSKHCVHMFHYDCCMEWLEKKNFCPYCRSNMFTDEEFRAAALEVLGPERTEELGLNGKIQCSGV